MVRYEATALGDPVRSFIDGPPEPCPQCYSHSMPIRVQLAPRMALVPYGPAVPTPEDILRGAGVL